MGRCVCEHEQAGGGDYRDAGQWVQSLFPVWLGCFQIGGPGASYSLGSPVLLGFLFAHLENGHRNSRLLGGGCEEAMGSWL